MLVKKNVDKKNFWSKKFFGQKKIPEKKNWSNKIPGQKKIWLKKFLLIKSFCSRKYFG